MTNIVKLAICSGTVTAITDRSAIAVTSICQGVSGHLPCSGRGGVLLAVS